MNFLPNNYESPKSSNYYMKLQEGENRIRILTQPVLGWEDWQEKKPIRSTFDNKPGKSFDPKKPVKHFWSFVVFNYVEEQIQILHLTQATIRKSIEALCRDKDWGAPYFYDIKIHKAGEGVDTEYTVNPVPHKPIDAYIISCFKERPCNLQAVFTNEDPFAPHWNSYATLAMESVNQVDFEQVKTELPAENIAELKKMFDECEPAYQKQLMNTLENLPNPVKSIENIPLSLYDKIKQAVIKKRNEYQEMIKHSDELFSVV